MVKKNKGLGGLFFGVTLGMLGALGAVFLGNKKNREKAVNELKKLKKRGGDVLKK